MSLTVIRLLALLSISIFSSYAYLHAHNHSSPAPDFNCTQIGEAGGFQTFILNNSRGMVARFIPYGATITHFHVPDRQGLPRDVVLGFDDPSFYCTYPQHPYFGAAIGRVANRIANCSFQLEGETYNLSCNENTNSSHPDTLHGGVIGFDRRHWDVVHYSQSSITFSLFSPDGEMGFPGDLYLTITYTLTENSWRITYSASSSSASFPSTLSSAKSSSKDTVVALTQHTYWNLNANVNNTATVLDHVLYVNASKYVKVNAQLIPTGEISTVSTAPWLDFTHAKMIGRDIANGTVTPQGGYDNALVFDDWVPDQKPTPRVILASPLTGITLSMVTDQPSVQFYSGNFLDGTIPRKKDQGGEDREKSLTQFYQRYGAAALEAQALPDSVHHKNFPSIVLKAGDTYTQFTEYIFGTF